MARQIILKSLQKPSEADIDDDIVWLGDSLGFCTGRDIERVTPNILRYALQDISGSGATSTEKISDSLNLAVQRVNYHLRDLIDSGFLYRQKRLIYLRQGSVRAAVEEMRRDANRIFDSLSEMAEEIDSALGLKSRV